VSGPGCTICKGPAGDHDLHRVQVWEDALWRLSMATTGFTTGFAYLEPKRHIPHITDLDGDEAATFGPVMARVTSALKAAAGAELVWVYVFGGGIPHLHVHLAPHREGDALNSQMIRGEVELERLASGASRIISRDFERLTDEQTRPVIERTRELLAEL
jgi:diadenosine tetraphosphate (Ap4A) HIT family hydrolase